jgi:hypothetical protein
MSEPGCLDEDCVFSVVGQHREDPSLLLLRGEDGRFYQLDPADGVPTAVEFAEQWKLDTAG